MLTVHQKWDVAGRPERIINENGTQSWFVWDALDRLIQENSMEQGMRSSLGKGCLLRFMSIINKFLILSCCIFAAGYAFGANASHPSNKCIIPAPDGGNADVASTENIHGKIIEKTNSTITVQNKYGKALVRFNKKTELYTVFGGDGPLDVLRPGLEVWIWFQNCKKTTKKTPLANTIFIYSTDPDDVNPDR